ncbi:hypothetical protein [Stenotrophomonas rhizophila]
MTVIGETPAMSGARHQASMRQCNTGNAGVSFTCVFQRDPRSVGNAAHFPADAFVRITLG